MAGTIMVSIRLHIQIIILLLLCHMICISQDTTQGRLINWSFGVQNRKIVLIWLPFPVVIRSERTCPSTVRCSGCIWEPANSFPRYAIFTATLRPVMRSGAGSCGPLSSGPVPSFRCRGGRRSSRSLRTPVPSRSSVPPPQWCPPFRRFLRTWRTW